MSELAAESVPTRLPKLLEIYGRLVGIEHKKLSAAHDRLFELQAEIEALLEGVDDVGTFLKDSVDALDAGCALLQDTLSSNDADDRLFDAEAAEAVAEELADEIEDGLIDVPLAGTDDDAGFVDELDEAVEEEPEEEPEEEESAVEEVEVAD